MVIKKQSLKDMIEKSNWVKISNHSRIFSTPDIVMVRCYFRNNKQMYVRVRMGIDIIKKLGWKEGDKIAGMYDKDNVLSFLCVKSENDVGRTLGKESGTQVYFVEYKWAAKFTLQPCKAEVLDYQIYKQYINFKIPQP